MDHRERPRGLPTSKIGQTVLLAGVEESTSIEIDWELSTVVGVPVLPSTALLRGTAMLTSGPPHGVSIGATTTIEGTGGDDLTSVDLNSAVSTTPLDSMGQSASAGVVDNQTGGQMTTSHPPASTNLEPSTSLEAESLSTGPAYNLTVQGTFSAQSMALAAPYTAQESGTSLPPSDLSESLPLPSTPVTASDTGPGPQSSSTTSNPESPMTSNASEPFPLPRTSSGTATLPSTARTPSAQASTTPTQSAAAGYGGATTATATAGGGAGPAGPQVGSSGTASGTGPRATTPGWGELTGPNYTVKVLPGQDALGPVRVFHDAMVLGVPARTEETVYAPFEQVNPHPGVRTGPFRDVRELRQQRKLMMMCQIEPSTAVVLLWIASESRAGTPRFGCYLDRGVPGPARPKCHAPRLSRCGSHPSHAYPAQVHIIVSPGAWSDRRRTAADPLTLTVFEVPATAGLPGSVCGPGLLLGPPNHSLATPILMSLPCGDAPPGDSAAAFHFVSLATGSSEWVWVQEPSPSNASGVPGAVWVQVQSMDVQAAFFVLAAGAPVTVLPAAGAAAAVASSPAVVVPLTLGAAAIVSLSGFCFWRHRRGATAAAAEKAAAGEPDVEGRGRRGRRRTASLAFMKAAADALKDEREKHPVETSIIALDPAVRPSTDHGPAFPPKTVDETSVGKRPRRPRRARYSEAEGEGEAWLEAPAAPQGREEPEPRQVGQLAYEGLRPAAPPPGSEESNPSSSNRQGLPSRRRSSWTATLPESATVEEIEKAFRAAMDECLPGAGAVPLEPVQRPAALEDIDLDLDAPPRRRQRQPVTVSLRPRPPTYLTRTTG